MARRRTRTLSPTEQLHADWLGMIQPQGLVVSIPVLVEASAYIRQETAVQARLRSLAPDDALDRQGFFAFLTEVLGWKESRIQTADLDAYRLAMPDLGVELLPDAVLKTAAGKPLLLVRWSAAPEGGDVNPFDQKEDGARFPLSRQAALERLLVELQRAEGEGTPIALHGSPEAIRLTYAPRGEAPGSLTFPVEAMLTWDGRILVDALLMLAGHDRLFTVPSEQRLPALLRRSRERQEEVTTALASQVQEALQILVAGFNVANQRARGRLLADWRDGDDSVRLLREGLTSVILRLVFLLYCEDARDSQNRGILPLDNPLYADGYSVGGLASALAEARVRFAEAMSDRYGAWARLCALFRLVFEGVNHKLLFLPPRQGELFDPGRFPFLEGRGPTGSWTTEGGEVPAIDDGVVDGVLENLVFLEGQRVSYRNLDVEQLGSVYEALMELDLHRAQTPAFRLRNGRIIERWQLEEAARPLDLLAAALNLKSAADLLRREALAAASLQDESRDWAERLAGLLAKEGTLQAGDLYLQGGSERRQTGSHYTPQALTSRIVQKTLDPVVGEAPSADKILSLKVCDLAMGSGAFLAESCRYLGRRLREAWTREDSFPADATTDPELVARRMVAERCLYGVDKNPFAVNLARLSLWLVTLSRDMPFTFVNHALAEGDSVIGVAPHHIENFSLETKNRQVSIAIRKAMQSAERARRNIHQSQRDLWREKSAWLRDARQDVASERKLGDILLAIAWAEKSASKQRKLRDALHMPVMAWYTNGGEGALPQQVQDLCDALPMRPFHWSLEFPEVFLRDNPGFDAIVGNPPFGGKNTILAANGDRYINLFQALHPHAHGNADLSAYFFLRAAAPANEGGILRKTGCFGLVASNTIKQGDTRQTGLQYLVDNGVVIYAAEKDRPWVGGAAVIVDVVHGSRGAVVEGATLDGATVEAVNSSLEVGQELPDPQPLKENAEVGFIGSYVLGTGFFLDPVEAMALIEADPRNAEIVRPFIGGSELNSNLPDGSGIIGFSRYVIDFGDRELEETLMWPDLIEIVRTRVKPERDILNENGDGKRRKRLWWQFGRRVPGLDTALIELQKNGQTVCLTCSLVSKYLAFDFQPINRIFSHKLCVIAKSDLFSYAVLQSSVHNSWAWALSSTMKTDLNYSPSRCFSTFPFPGCDSARYDMAVAVGKSFNSARKDCMYSYGEGMTKVWNRVMDPANTDADIVNLRRLKREMDEAVLAAYGWSDLSPDDTKAIVRRLRALNATRHKGKPDPTY